MGAMTSPLDFDRLVELRRLYPRRGPRDGRPGLTPDGRVGMPLRYSLAAVAHDADAAMRLGPSDHARWRHGMGLDDPPAAPPEPPAWHDPCPARGPGLEHARTRSDPSGRCAHCGAEGLVWRGRP